MVVRWDDPTFTWWLKYKADEGARKEFAKLAKEAKEFLRRRIREDPDLGRLLLQSMRCAPALAWLLDELEEEFGTTRSGAGRFAPIHKVASKVLIMRELEER